MNTYIFQLILQSPFNFDEFLWDKDPINTSVGMSGFATSLGNAIIFFSTFEHFGNLRIVLPGNLEI